MGRSWSLAVLLVISVLWKPALTDNKCSIQCKGTPTGATFLSGQKYTYGVEGTVSVYLTGADKQQTSVKLLGQAAVTSLGNCGYELKVQNLVISGPDGKKHGSPPGIDKPIHFSLQDGRLGAEICTEDGDTRRSLNIKRAIISLLQTENKPSTQIDVFGACPTEATSSQEGAALLVHRTRDLSRCAHRESGRHDLINGVFNPTAEIKNTQVLQSTLHVESKVNAGIPEKVSATEEYLYKPFSVGENGARAKVHTKLTLTGKAAGAAGAATCTNSRTVIFENPHGITSAGHHDAALAALKDTARTLSSEASSKSAGEFAQLVRILRNVNKEDLMKIWGQIKTGNVEKRVFLDALLRAGTGCSVEASVEIIKQGNQLSPIEQQLIFLSLGNVKHVDSAAVKAASTLLDLPNIPKELYLGVGAVAGVYCRDHDCHNDKTDGITAVSSKLAAKVNCRPKTKAEEDTVVAVLKGVRNIRHLEDNLIDKVIRCANDNSAKARVRVAALEAFGADPCSAKLKKAAIELMKNVQLDSEIRIKAYLAIIQCPCGGSANEIKTLLDSEPVHQVGRFISSSLRHIRASTNPDKKLARQHYGLIGTPNKFNVDDRKYSFYRELSYNVDALGIGGSAEETVIYSQDSFLPRSVNFNLTAELFGHSLNMLEVGGRQGNLDRVIEHFLGPKSFLRTEKPQDIYDDLVMRFHEAGKKVEDSLKRGRRSVKTEVDNFDKHLKAESVPFNNELDLDIFVKLFGTDAIFLSLGDDKGLDANNLLVRLLKTVSSGLDEIKHFKHEIRTHLLFLDAELAYPTSTGLPLKLDLVGSATGRLDLASNVDVRQIIRNPKNAKIDVKIVPSTDIEIAGLFLIDADAVATGLKVFTNLHSSTGGHVILKILEEGHGFDLQLGLPIEKQEIVTASNDLVYFTAEKGHKEKHIPLKIDVDRKDYTACFDQLSGLLGLTVCGEISVPFHISGPEAQASISKFLARYPLTGPSKLKLVLEKSDLKGYHVKGVLRTDNPEKQNFELLFEAEGSKNRRTSLTGDMIRTKDEKSLKLALESPLKNVYGELSYITKPNERVALVKGKYDQDEYYAKAGFIVQGNDKKSVYKPIIEYELPDKHGKQSLKVEGQLTREVNGPATKYTLEGIKINMPSSNEVIDINGHLNQEPKNLELEIKAKKGEHNMAITGSLKEHDIKLEFQNTLNPFVNFMVNGHIENGADVHHNDIEVHYGQDLKNSKNRVVFNQLLKYHKPTSDKDWENVNVITKNKFEISALPVKLQIDANVDRKKVDIDVEAVYLDKKGEFELEARTNIKKPGDYSVKVNAELDKKGVEAFAKRDIVSADKSNLENYVVIKGLGKYELSGVVLHKTKPNDINVGAIGHLKISGGSKGEDIKFDIGAVETAGMYSSHAKVSSSKGEVLDYLLKITRGANANGQLKFVLKDAIAANGQYKVTDNDGKGHGMVIVDFKKSQRKIKADVKFVVKDPICNVDVDVFLNLDKDNNDKIHVSTNSKITGKVIDSKNKIEYAGKNAEVNVHRDGAINGLGKSHAKVEVVLPTERCLTLNLDQEVDIKDDVVNGNVHYVLSDAVKRGGPASSISFKSKASDTNYDKMKLNLEGQLEVKLKDGKNLDNKFYIRNTPEGEDKYKYDFKTEVTGNLIPKPASLSASGTTTGGLSKWEFDEKYRMKANYGTDASLDLEGIVEIKLPIKGDGKYHDDFTLAVRLPFEKAHDFKWVSNVLFLLPQDKQVLAEYTLVQSVQLNADTYKFDASGKCGTKEGFNKMKAVCPHVDPLVLETSYKADTEEEMKKLNVDIKSQYGKGKTATVALAVHGAAREFGLDLVAQAPQAEKLKKLEVKMLNKLPTPDTFKSSMSLDADGRVYSYDLTAVNSRSHPVIDLKYHCPNQPKDSRIFIKGSNITPGTGGKIEIKLDNVRDVSLDAVSEALISKDNVALKFSGNSEQLKMKNYQVDISSKEAGSGKRLEFHASNDGKNLLSGSTSFISKQEGPKTIIEGSGSVKVKDDQKSANFKYIRTLLTEGSEQGVETFLNLAIGERSYVAEYRVTNLEYKSSYVYCEEKKQCANAEIHSKFNVPKPGTFQHILNIGFDLRKLGFAPEFGLQVSNSVAEKQLPQYNLDLHVNKEEKKYHLHAYSQPEHGKFPAGITVTLPQRVLALESIMTYPTNKGMPFPIKGEISLHLDKNKPNLMTAARFLVDVTGSKDAHSLLAEFGFVHPKLGKEALIKLKSNMARKAEYAIKIETVTSFSHSTLGKDREAKLLLDVDPTHFIFLVNSPLVKVIDIEATAVLKDNLQQGDIKLSLLEGKPVSMHGMVKDYQYYEFTSGYTDEQERKLSIIGHIEPEKRMDISADIILPNDKKNIIHGALYIQDNLVKSEYGLSKENFQYFVSALQKDLQTLETRVKGLGEKASNELKDTLKRVQPTFVELNKATMEDLDKLFKEVANDQALKEISEGLHQIVTFFAKLADEVMQVSKPIVEKITHTIGETCKKVQEMYEKQIEPQLKQVYGNLSKAIREYLEGLLDIVAHFAAIAQDFFEKHKPELEELTNTIAEIFKDLTRLIVAHAKEFRAKTSEWLQNALQQLKDLPIINIIKEKWQELAVPEQVFGLLHGAHTAWRDLMPTWQSKVAEDAVYNYIQKKLRQEKVDDAAELRDIYEKMTAALTSLVQFYREQMSGLGLPSIINLNSLPLFAVPGQASVPAPGGVVSFSIVNQLLKGDLPDPLAIIRAYRPRSFNPLDEMPNKLRAVVVNGQHIFTFDGRHLTFPGTCRYVLAHDHVDRNFTLIIQLQNGAPKALILEDKSGNVVELKENGQVTLNGAAHGFPVDNQDTFAFRQPNGRIGLGSSYGIMALCTSKLQVCYIQASGFYLGKLRGLLGDGNNEPFDDFRMPNGKITTSESEFGNSYKLASSCPAAKVPEHSHHQHHAALPPACEQVFGGASPLRPLGLLLDAAPFRQACIHAVTADSTNAIQQACDLGRGYTALAVTGMLPAVLPSVCVQCTDADQPRNIGDTFEVKLPNKQADIVVAFETTKSNEANYKELVVPLVGQLIETLKKDHITDVKVYLVGVTPRMPYPLLYDTDLKLKNAKVRFDDETRYGTLPRVQTLNPQVNKVMTEVLNIVDYVRIKLGLHNIVAGYASVMDLPLRPGALKHTINVVGEHCKPSFAPLSFLRSLAYSAAFEQMAYTHTLVTVTPDLKLGGGKAADQVVGFTEDAVLLLGDKKITKDSEALRPTLQVNDDACIDFIENTDGLVLSATNFLAAKDKQKQFIQTAASSITRQMVKQTLVQECVCGYSDPFRVRSVCVNKERKDAARRRK